MTNTLIAAGKHAAGISTPMALLRTEPFLTEGSDIKQCR